MYETLEVPREATRSPSTWDSATELPRVVLEMTSLTYLWPLFAAAPRGDGHRVLVLPGFTAGDGSTLVLRRLLERLKYTALPWELGQNTGSFELQEQLYRRFLSILDSSPEPVSLVGQSLGGVYARVLAHRWPDQVRQVITLGSPFASSSPETVNSLVSRLFQAVSGMTREEMRNQMEDFPPGAPPVPTTAVYSKNDGVVHWSTCLETESNGAPVENVQVLGSHSGMAFNPMVLNVIVNRLAQPADYWRPFKQTTGLCGFAYPRSRSRRRTSSRG